MREELRRLKREVNRAYKDKQTPEGRKRFQDVLKAYNKAKKEVA